MRKFLTLSVIVLSSLLSYATAQTITGTVLNATDGEPIIGASVVVEGSTTGTITDTDGKFTLSVEEGKKVTVSFLGMAPQTVSASNGMVVRLSEDAKALDEVVVTAFGISRSKKSLGYAEQTLDASDLSIAGSSSLASAIQGKLTGVSIRQSSGAPGASSQITIRGARSFDGNNAPLYVIDGMPIESSPDFSTGNSVTGSDYANRSIDINPEDIESINVLKGQAASALYGLRASNGVIVITTKRGSKAASKPVITVTTDFSAQTLSRKFEHQDVYAQGNSINAYSPTSSMTWGPKITDLPNDPTYGGNVANDYTNSGNDLHSGQYYNPKLAAAGLSGWTTPQTFDNVGDFFNTGFTQNATVNISQNKENVGYSFSVSDTYQEGIIPSTGMMRTGARGAVDLKINDQWKTGFTSNYSTTKITSAPGANNGIVNVVYGAPAEYNLKGIPTHAPNDPTSQILYRSTNFNNPYWWSDNDEFRQHTNRFFGNTYVEFSPKFKNENLNLTLREQAGLDMYTTDNKTTADVGSGYNSKGVVYDIGVQRHVFNNLFTANFTAKFGSDNEWDLGILLGNEYNQDRSRNWDYEASGLSWYGQKVIENAASMDYFAMGNLQDRTVGFFGQLSASWKDQLFLTVTGRNDIVSTMPRASWAQVGQAGTYRDNFYYAPSYGSGFYAYSPLSYPVGGQQSFVPYYVSYDPNLKPQNTTSYEAGTDLHFWNDRIRLDYTYSFQDAKDQIFDVPTAGSMGYQYLRTNAGRMTVNSHELSLNAAIVQTKDWGVDLGINFTKIKNDVKELAPGVESIMLGGFVEPQVRAMAGHTYPNIYGTAFKRNEAGQLLLDEDGMPQGTASSENLGECTPDFNMGFNLSARWKNLSLSATLDWQKGGKMYAGTLLVMNYFGATKASVPWHEGTFVPEGINEATGEVWTKEVSKQDYYMAYNDITEAGIFDASYLKFRDISLNYQLPKLGGLDINLFVFARNILVWAKIPDIDPENSQGNGNMSGYFERFSVPNTSSFGGGLKLTF